MKTAGVSDQSTGQEWLEVESLVVKDVLRRGVAGQKNLKAAVQAEARDFVGANSASDSVGRLQHKEASAPLVQQSPAAQPRQAGTDNQYVVCHLVCPVSRSSGAALPSIHQTLRVGASVW